MKKLLVILIAVATIVACNNAPADQKQAGNSTLADGTIVDASGQPLAYDACSCAKYLDGNSPEYAKCKELRKADPKFNDDYQQCLLAQKSGLDTNQVKLKKANDIAALSSTSGNYTFDLSKSKIVWRGEKATGKTHKGTIALREGTLVMSGGKITGGGLSIDMSTIKVTDEDATSSNKLEGHLKSPDFFDTAKFPYAKFEITSVGATNGQNVELKGNLTIKGITKPATTNVVLVDNSDKILFGGSLVFDRAEFDVRYGSDNFFQNLGNDLIKDEILLTFDVLAVKQ